MEENKTNINWFPGHMAKTRKQIEEDLKLVDVVIEILDARIPISSQNPDIQQILSKSTKHKKRIIILNKSDLADRNETEKWKKYFNQEKNIRTIITDLSTGEGVSGLIKQIKDEMQEELKNSIEKGRVGRIIRVMVVGIPNVGKSSFINKISKKNSLEVGNKPGVTKSKQWIRIDDGIELLDTPGVLWPKFESEDVALNLSYTGSIKDDILDKVEVAYQFLKYMINNYRENICLRYGFNNEELKQLIENEEINGIYEIMQIIGKKRGAIISGGVVDDEKTARIILEDFRSGKMGRITLEKVN